MQINCENCILNSRSIYGQAKGDAVYTDGQSTK